VKTFTVEQAARSFESVLEEVERTNEEVVLVRRKRRVARLVPEPKHQTALEIFSDLEGILDEKAGKALAEGVKLARKGKSKRLSSLRNPWAS
jgi:antitoxin (DNA-binding transcriptional repressor) of toxin-antitoxin stability system